MNPVNAYKIQIGQKPAQLREGEGAGVLGFWGG